MSTCTLAKRFRGVPILTHASTLCWFTLTACRCLDLQGLPPIHIEVATREHLCDQSTAFADQARAAGVTVGLHKTDNVAHDFIAFSKVSKPAVAVALPSPNVAPIRTSSLCTVLMDQPPHLVPAAAFDLVNCALRTFGGGQSVYFRMYMYYVCCECRLAPSRRLRQASWRRVQGSPPLLAVSRRNFKPRHPSPP